MSHDHRSGACPSCGAAIVALNGSTPVRCDACFTEYLRKIDIAFLEAYADFGSVSRRVVAEACLRELVIESPPHRKALAAAIFEQFVLTATDLVALYRAVEGRADRPIIEGFLDFRLDERTAGAFFQRLAAADDDDLLGALGLPHPADVRASFVRKEGRFADADRRTAAALEDALRTLLRGLRRLEAGPKGALALLAARQDGPSVLVGGGTWEARSLEPHEVATLTLDAARRRISVRAVPTDEHALADVVDAVGSCSAAARDMVFALLTLNDFTPATEQPPIASE